VTATGAGSLCFAIVNAHSLRGGTPARDADCFTHEKLLNRPCPPSTSGTSNAVACALALLVVFFRLWDEVMRQRLLRACETEDSLTKLLAGREVR